MSLPSTSEIEEGDRCYVLGCTGRFELRPVEGCTCFQSAPCSACIDNPLLCSKCEIKIEVDDGSA